MSQPQNTYINGPSDEISQPSQDTTKVIPAGNGSLPHPTNEGFVRPPLTRLDSRSSISPRLGYPNQQGTPYRPQQHRPPFVGVPQFGPRPPLQRNPSSGQFNPAQNQLLRQGSPNPNAPLRPSTPFPRTQGHPPPRPPGIYQQKSFPSPGVPKPPVVEQLPRSQTLDTPDLTPAKNVDPALPARANEEETPPALAAMKNRSFSLASNVNEAIPSVDNRRFSASSLGSVEENRNYEIKTDDVPSRPESRAHMNKILEDEDVINTKLSKSPVLAKNTDSLIDQSERKSPVGQKIENATIAASSDPPIKTPKMTDINKTSHPSSPSPSPDMQPPKEVDKNKMETPIKKEEIIRSRSADKNKIEASGSVEKIQKTVNEPKLNLQLDDQNTVKSSSKSKVGETSRSPTPSQRTIVAEKPKTLKPDARNDNKNGMLKSPTKSEGDNDSGVDESTQGNDQSSNGDHSSPRKSSGKIPTRTTASPTKSRSVSRGSKSPNPKTPDSPTPSTPGTNDKKKLPMNKVHVGSAPSPNLKVVKSKIGSFQNTSYKPGGGNIKIEHKKIDLSNAQSKIAAKNETYIPGGGEKKIEHRKLQWNVSSKINSLDNAHHKPKGGEKKIESIKLDFKDKAKPKVGSKDNIKYQPGGGDVKSGRKSEELKQPAVKEIIETKKIDLKAKSKIGSLDNVKYKPGGGDKKIFDDKEYLRQKSGMSGENNSLNGSQNSLPSQEVGEPVSDENLNRE